MQNTKKTYCKCSCGHVHCIDKREISLFKGMDVALAKIYKWCLENNRHEFQRKEIEHLLIDGNQKARFGDWVLFGGLVYKGEKKGDWGLNIGRCEMFFNNKKAIATKVLKDPITGEIEKFDFRFCKDIPELYTFLDENKLFNPNYVPRDLFNDNQNEQDDIIVI